MTTDTQSSTELIEPTRDDESLAGSERGHFQDALIGVPLLRFELLDARQHRDRAVAFFEKKHACYAKFGAAAASVSLENSNLDHVHIVVATDTASGATVGGIAIYRHHPASTLPMERSIGHIESVKPEIASWRGHHVVEFSALWADEAWRKTGISAQLMLIAFAAAHLLSADKIVGFGHHHLLAFYGTMGLRRKPSIEQIRYPSPEYLSTVLEGDPVGLSTLPPDNQSRVRDFIADLAHGRMLLWPCESMSLAATP